MCRATGRAAWYAEHVKALVDQIAALGARIAAADAAP